MARQRSRSGAADAGLRAADGRCGSWLRLPAEPRGNALLQFGSRVGHSTRKDRLGHQHHAAILAHVLDRRLGRLEIRSEEHTSELQSLMRISYAVFCLKKNKRN